MKCSSSGGHRDYLHGDQRLPELPLVVVCSCRVQHFYQFLLASGTSRILFDLRCNFICKKVVVKYYILGKIPVTNTLTILWLRTTTHPATTTAGETARYRCKALSGLLPVLVVAGKRGNLTQRGQILT